MVAQASFDYNNHYYSLEAPSFQALFSGCKYFVNPFDLEWISISTKLGITQSRAVVDAGACIGVFSILFSQMNPDVRVYAYEPADINFKYLESNTKPYTNITCVKKALYNRNGVAEIALPTLEQKQYSQTRRQEDNSGIISVYGKSDIHRETVELAKLDDELEYADFIKIDAEGSDLAILQGAREIIMRSRPIIMFEYLQCNLDMAGTTFEDFSKFFNEVYYELAYQWRHDVLMIPKELADALRSRNWELPLRPTSTRV